MRLQIENVSKSFQGVQALAGVSLSIEPGEIHALMGENGAGKSTLIKIITGVIRPDTGAVLLNGEPVVFRSPRDASSAGIAVVHQERNLIPRFTVAENIMLERPPVTMRGWVDFDAARQRARQALGLLDPTIDVDRQVRTLSVAQMQMVEIAKALSIEAKVLLLDEPTASLTDHETSALVDVLRRLRANGVAIVFVSHKLGEVMSLSDRVSVLRDGRVVAQGAHCRDVSRTTGLADDRSRGAHRPHRSQFRRRGDRYRIEAGLNFLRPRGLSLSLRAGEILGLYGLVGAGRTELARALVGVGEVTGGAVYVGGEPAPRSATRTRRSSAPHWLRQRGPQGRRAYSCSSRGDKFAMTIWRRSPRRIGLVSAGAESDAPPLYRSSGDQDRFSTGSVSPFGRKSAKGVDREVARRRDRYPHPRRALRRHRREDQGRIHELIAGIAREGVSVMLISSDMAEMITLADRILVLHDFRVAGEVANDHRYEPTSAAIMASIHAVEPAEAGAA